MIKLRIDFKSVVVAVLGAGIIVGITNTLAIKELRKLSNELKEEDLRTNKNLGEVMHHLVDDVVTLQDELDVISKSMTEMQNTDDVLLKSFAGHSAAISTLAEKARITNKVEQSFLNGCESHMNLEMLKTAAKMHKMVHEVPTADSKFCNGYGEE